jgi:hypothetical protein
LTHAIYANGVTMDISGDFPNGIKFYGSEGWIFVTRDVEVTASDPSGKPQTLQPLMASDAEDSGERDRGRMKFICIKAMTSMATGWNAFAAGRLPPRRPRLGTARAPLAWCIILP